MEVKPLFNHPPAHFLLYFIFFPSLFFVRSLFCVFFRLFFCFSFFCAKFVFCRQHCIFLFDVFRFFVFGRSFLVSCVLAVVYERSTFVGRRSSCSVRYGIAGYPTGWAYHALWSTEGTVRSRFTTGVVYTTSAAVGVFLFRSATYVLSFLDFCHRSCRFR